MLLALLGLLLVVLVPVYLVNAVAALIELARS
jgi:hypothetical protein